jgi:hypothetical protein
MRAATMQRTLMLSIRNTMKTRIAGAIGVIATVALLSIGAAASANALSASGSSTKSGPSAERVLNSKVATAASTIAGCADGYVCLYPEGVYWRDSSPEQRWYNYGSYNLVNKYNMHWIFNNQTGGAKAYICTGSGGGGSCELVPAGWSYYRNFTPINSVKLAS